MNDNTLDPSRKRLREKALEVDFKAVFYDFNFAVRTVEAAARALGIPVSEMTKNLLLLDESGTPVIAVLVGNDKLDIAKLESFVGRKLRMAKVSEVPRVIGFEAGAVPLVGIDGLTVLDERAATKQFLYGSGGDTLSLSRLETKKVLEKLAPRIANIAVSRDL